MLALVTVCAGCVSAVCTFGIIMVRDSRSLWRMLSVLCVLLLLHEIHVKICLHCACSVDIPSESCEADASVDDHLDSLALLKCALQMVSYDLAQCEQVKAVAVKVVF